MAEPRIVIVGAGPAGVSAARACVSTGYRPVVIDEANASGGQIYRRQPPPIRRRYADLYGFEARKAKTQHDMFDQLLGSVDYRPGTLAWALTPGVVYTSKDDVVDEIPYDALILATGATDRLLPIRGWTLPGCYSLGGAQVALKAQACAIGENVVFLGTGPLLYLVSHQYARAGANVAAVLDTSPVSGQVKAMALLARRPKLLAKGLCYRATLAARRIPVYAGITPLAIEGVDAVAAIRFRDAGDTERRIDCDAVGIGFHLRSETQLADLARCDFEFDDDTRQWRPRQDPDGRLSMQGVYAAGDGARILGADAAEISGELAALAALRDLGASVPEQRVRTLRRRQRAMEAFRRGLAIAFPWPSGLARCVADDVMLCRCEAITAGELRRAASEQGAPELNRAKALVRVGMGRCQGRYCASAAAEILADVRDESLEAVGRLRGQAPVKPVSMALRKDSSA